MTGGSETLRMLILSDLHFEFRRGNLPVFDLRNSKPDVVILAGDIDTDAVGAVHWAEEQFRDVPVLYVHGNHEGYGKKLDNVIERLDAACASSRNVSHLHRREFVYKRTRFLGVTLWTGFDLFGADRRTECMKEARAVMSDYRSIRLAQAGYRKLTPVDTLGFHQLDREWLAKRLDEPFDGNTVVVTHMAPSIKSVAPQYMNDPTSAAYASNLDHLVEKADLWIHGHMHTSLDYRIGKCRVVCNPCGYLSKAGEIENRSFRPDYIVELGARTLTKDKPSREKT